jgi:cell division protein FtsW
VVVYLASILQKKEGKLDRPLSALTPPLIIIFAFAFIIFLQNDLSTAFFILAVAMAMLFIARVKMTFFITVGLVLLPLGGVLILMKPYWIEKLFTFLYPTSDPYNTGYQISQSKLALQLGGLLGQGVGMSTRKLYVPEADSDLIFAVTGEELGFIGLAILIILFCLFALRGYSISFRNKNNFAFYLGFGITTTIFLQAVLNMLVTAGLIPATGMPLPFFSLGGSAMLVTLLMCGVMINISRSKDADGGYFHG